MQYNDIATLRLSIVTSNVIGHLLNEILTLPAWAVSTAFTSLFPSSLTLTLTLYIYLSIVLSLNSPIQAFPTPFSMKLYLVESATIAAGTPCAGGKRDLLLHPYCSSPMFSLW